MQLWENMERPPPGLQWEAIAYGLSMLDELTGVAFWIIYASGSGEREWDDEELKAAENNLQILRDEVDTNFRVSIVV